MLIALLFSIVTAHAQDVSFLRPTTTDKVSVSLEDQHIAAPADDRALSLQSQKGSFSIPVYQGFDSGVAFIARGQRMNVGEKLTFPNSGVALPREFGAADFGFAWGRESQTGNKVGVSATYGNAGTRLFSGESSPIVAANFVMERNKVDHSWYYFLSYSNNRTVLNGIPLPGVAYGMNGESYMAVFGLPFAFANWHPDPFSLTGALSPFGALVDAGYRIWGPLQLYATANWTPSAYQNLVKGSKDRLIVDQKELGTGLRLLAGRMGSLSVGYGYLFGRRFLLGTSITDRDAEKITVGNSSGVDVKLRISF